MIFRAGAILALLAGSVALPGQAQWTGPTPEVKAIYGGIPARFQQYEVILQPDQNAPDWWAGAPSVVRDRNGVFWLA